MELGPSFSYDRCSFKRKTPLSREPFAIVSYTAFDETYEEPIKVNETTYHKTKEGLSAFKGQIFAALDAGFDVSVMTSYPIEKLIKLLDFASSQ